MKMAKWERMKLQYDLGRPAEAAWKRHSGGLKGNWFQLARSTERLVWIFEQKV